MPNITFFLHEESSSQAALSAADPGVNDKITGWSIDWDDGVVETLVGNPSQVTHTYDDNDPLQPIRTIKATALQGADSFPGNPWSVEVLDRSPTLTPSGPDHTMLGDVYVLTQLAPGKSESSCPDACFRWCPKRRAAAACRTQTASTG